MSVRSKSEAVRVIVALYRQFERAIRDEDMSLTHYRTLLYLSTGPKRAGAIAAEAAVKKPTVSATLNVLRHKGWVEDRADPADGRVTQVVLTGAGRTRIKAFEATLAKRIEAVLPGFDVAELHAVLGGAYRTLAESRDARQKDIERQFLD